MEESLIYPLPNRAWLDVSVPALRANALSLQGRTGLPLIPMVKANAYGVGAEGVVRALEAIEPLAYGVAAVAEGESLRALGVRRPVIVFTPILEAEHGRARAADLTPALGDARSIESWAATGRAYHLAIDTGMSRSGLQWRDVTDVYDAVRRWPPAAAFTHFHSAELDDGSADLQMQRFLGAVDAMAVPIRLLHADNSAAAVLGVDGYGRLGAMRPGIFLYGVGTAPGLRPEPVITLRARVVDIRWIESGDTVSYDATFTAQTRMRIATTAVGYGDGYPRALSDRAVAVLNGRPVPQRGLVTMDMTMFDVTDTQCEIGDVVTLIGDCTAADLSVETIARLAGMSPYQLLTGMTPRLERRYNDGR